MTIFIALIVSLWMVLIQPTHSFATFAGDMSLFNLHTKRIFRTQPFLLGASFQQPFSDEIYDHLRFVISCFTAKIKHGVSLNSQELSRLKVSIRAIIDDAAAARNPDSPQQQLAILRADDGENPFQAIRRQSNSWAVAGMEDMNVDQYYQALNERNQKIRSLRNEAGDIQADEYDRFVSELSRKRRQEDE